LSEHLTEIQARDYGRRKLSSAELLSLSDHLAECEACRRLIEPVASGDTAFLALRSGVLGDGEWPSPPEPPAHLTAEQTAGYAEGILAGEELQTIADHLNNCEQCALAVGDLGDFIGPLRSRPFCSVSSVTATLQPSNFNSNHSR